MEDNIDITQTENIEIINSIMHQIVGAEKEN